MLLYKGKYKHFTQEPTAVKNYKKNRNNTPIIITISVILLLLLGAGVVYAWNASNNNQKSDIDKSSGINYEPPTEDEVRASQDGKKNSGSDSDKNTSSNSKTKLQVGIAYADINNGQLEIRAFTNGTITGDGLCTATVIKESTKITASSKSFVDAKSSQCQPIYIPSSQLTSGEWQVTVSFSTQNKEGVSDTVKVKIP